MCVLGHLYCIIWVFFADLICHKEHSFQQSLAKENCTVQCAAHQATADLLENLPLLLGLNLQQALPLVAAGMPHLLGLRGRVFALQSSLCFLIFLFHKVAESRSNYDPDPQCWPKKYSDFRSEK